MGQDYWPFTFDKPYRYVGICYWCHYPMFYPRKHRHNIRALVLLIASISAILYQRIIGIDNQIDHSIQERNARRHMLFVDRIYRFVFLKSKQLL